MFVRFDLSVTLFKTLKNYTKQDRYQNSCGNTSNMSTDNGNVCYIRIFSPVGYFLLTLSRNPRQLILILFSHYWVTVGGWRPFSTFYTTFSDCTPSCSSKSSNFLYNLLSYSQLNFCKLLEQIEAL